MRKIEVDQLEEAYIILFVVNGNVHPVCIADGGIGNRKTGCLFFKNHCIWYPFFPL